jgi:cellulose synthase/poly-beta-1,6-N-acetylglucosamine synthase-like glycosyltransferase
MPEQNLIRSVSIIIAARNEEDRIEPCLKSLELIDYPGDKFEVILVDDCSVDKTAEIMASYCNQHSNWKIIRIKEKSTQLKGKINALREGIVHAENELIFTTDADCVVPPMWLKNMVCYFQDHVSMVLGYSPLISENKWYYKLLQFDNLFSAIVAAAPVKLGYPFTSVGRNLAYKKEAYHELGGFQALKNFKSGDDIHLTNQFHRHDGGKIDYCADPQTFVYTLIPSSFDEVVQQQIRKNSKTFQLSLSSITFMLLIFIYYVLMIILPLAYPAIIIPWVLFVFIKFILEFIPLKISATIFKQKDIIPFIPLMQIIYPLYIITFSLIGSFQKYHWKK